MGTIEGASKTIDEVIEKEDPRKDMPDEFGEPEWLNPREEHYYTQTYRLVSDDDEINTMSICVEAMKQNLGGNFEAQQRVLMFLIGRVGQDCRKCSGEIKL